MKNILYNYRAILFFSAILFFAGGCTKKIEKILHDTSITSISPTTAGLGDTITVYGKHLPTDTTGVQVTINGKSLSIIQATPDSIKLVIVSTTGSGYVTVSYGEYVYKGPYCTYRYEAVVTTVAGSGLVGNADGAAGQASFNCPWGIVADRNSDLYIADCYNRLIRKISAADNTVSTFQLGSLNFYSPYNIALDTGTHNLYVTDFNTHVLKMHAAGDGVVINTTNFTTSTGIGLGPDGNLYISDNIAGTVSRIDTNGANYASIATGMFTPRNVIFDAAGNLYTPAYNGVPVVYQVKSDGTKSVVAQDGSFSGWEIARDTAGNFYEADHFNNVIRKIDKQGNATTIAGSGVAADVDGTGTNASFNGPQGLTIDVHGNLYVTTYNYDNAAGNKVRKISFR